MRKPIEGYEGHYDISDAGEIRSLTFRNRMTTKPRIRVLKVCPAPNGYLHVQLCKDGKTTDYRVHALVLETFVGPRPLGHCAAHLNSIKTDNRIANLTWATRSENESHKPTRGPYRSKLTAEQAALIRGDPRRLVAIATEYGISSTCVCDIKAGRRWAHV